jgi:transcriptional regulator with XRE-family HTH domain
MPYCSCVIQDEESLSPTRVVGSRLTQLRKARDGMTQEELAAKMRRVGIDWERITVAKLENGSRALLKLDEFMALCVVLEICPVDLLVPANMPDNDTYYVTPKIHADAGNAREWIRGEDYLYGAERLPSQGSKFNFVSVFPVYDIVRWMPKDRAERVTRRYLEEEERQERGEEESQQ